MEHARANEPKPIKPLRGRVEKLTKLEAACWDRVIQLSPPGVLTEADEIIVELTARLWATVKRREGTAAHATQLRACCQELGMSPASRSRVQGPPSESANEFRDV